MNNNRHHLEYSDNSYKFDDESISVWCQRNWFRLLLIIILAVLTIGTTTSLIVVVYKDVVKENALAEKRKGWIKKWETIKPYIKKLPVGIFLGFIRNLIVLAVDRQVEL